MRRLGTVAFACLLAVTTPADPLAASPSVPLRAAAVSAQGDFGRGCALVDDLLYCWGSNLQGELGIGAATLTSLAEWVRRPDLPSGKFEGLRSLAVQDRSCLVDAAGLWCWGNNSRGQLGVGDRLPRSVPTLVTNLPDDPLELVFGRSHGCLRTAASGVWCWGNNLLGETGRVPGTPVPDPQSGELLPPPQLLPKPVPGLPASVSAIDASEQHNCVLGSGTVMCWGDNLYGQLGDGGTTGHPTPAAVSGLPAGIVRIAVGPRHACAIDGAGEVWCWGYNFAGQIGVAPAADQQLEPLPRRVSGLGGAASALELGFVSSCALVGDARKCWGQMEDGTRIGPQPQVMARPAGAPPDWLSGCFDVDGDLRCPRTTRSPYTEIDAREVARLPRPATSLALGRNFACAALDDGSLWCWGDNSLGQLGQGDFAPRSIAVRVPLPAVRSASAGIAHACASTDDGLWCWGANGTGALGDGSSVDRPAPVRALFSGELLAAGGQHTCAYSSSAGLRCWGQNQFGQVGGSAGAPALAGAAPLGSAVVSELGAGFAHRCATIRLGAASETRCWGKIALTSDELANGVRDFAPRLLASGAALAPDDGPQLRVAAFTACAGDRCSGQIYLPPERGRPPLVNQRECTLTPGGQPG